MYKRKLAFILGLILILNVIFLGVSVNGVVDISSWAIEEVTAAESENIVPISLKSNYQTEIKRYEYVLLALELLKLKNDEVSIITKYPFTDIYEHTYEEEIVKAYNAGIIKGNGDGTFRPDDPINRQEIASLIVNLVERLDNKEITDKVGRYIYSDTNLIKDWAKGYINYCYNNEIMNGVGKDSNGIDKIDPLGQATREQAIMLLYRLADNKNLLSTTDLGTITVYKHIDDSGIKKAVQSETINEFTKIFSKELAKELINLSKLDNIRITDLFENYVLISFNNGGVIIISNDGYVTDITLELTSLSDTIETEQFIKLVEIIHDSTALEDVLYRDINSLKTDSTYSLELELSDKETYSSRFESNDEFEIFLFDYQLKNQ